jgi:DNA-binding MarR family transcriptional regulator
MSSQASGDFFEQHAEPLSDRIAVALSKIGLALKQQATRSAGEHGLSPTQAQILALLQAEARLRPTDLAAKLGVSLATVSESAKTLVSKGLLSKTPDERNARATLLTLTKSGKASARTASDWPDFLASAVDCLSDTEQEAFLQTLLKMIRTLQERGEIPIARMCVTCKFFRPFQHPGDRPHHCALVNAAMGTRHLRVECAEHEAAFPEAQAATWRTFIAGPPAK